MTLIAVPPSEEKKFLLIQAEKLLGREGSATLEEICSCAQIQGVEPCCSQLDAARVAHYVHGGIRLLFVTSEFNNTHTECDTEVTSIEISIGGEQEVNRFQSNPHSQFAGDTVWVFGYR